jgi:hypothetical protein
VILNHSRSAVKVLAGLALLCGVGLIACERPATPGVTLTPPRESDAETPTDADRPEKPPTATEADTEPGAMTAPRDDVADTNAATIDIEEPGEPRPGIPRFISITEEIEPQRLSSVDVAVLPPRKLELNTENIKRLRLTREGLPLAKNSSIVLRIDGQGIEWTPRYIAVELERSPTGLWTVIGRRAYQP